MAPFRNWITASRFITVLAVTIIISSNYVTIDSSFQGIDLSYQKSSLLSNIFAVLPLTLTGCHNAMKAFQFSRQHGAAAAAFDSIKADPVNWLKLATPFIIIIPNAVLILIKQVQSDTFIAVLSIQLLISTEICLTMALKNDVGMQRQSYACIALTLFNCTSSVLWYFYVISTTPKALAVIEAIAMCLRLVVLITALYRILSNNKIIYYEEGNLFTTFGRTNSRAESTRNDARKNMMEETTQDPNGSYTLYMIIIIVNWLLSMRGYSAEVFYTSQSYLLSCAVMFIMVFFDRRMRDCLILASIASDLHRGFVRFVSHELRSHLSHLTMGLEQLTDETPAVDKGKLKMIEELQVPEIDVFEKRNR